MNERLVRSDWKSTDFNEKDDSILVDGGSDRQWKKICEDKVFQVNTVVRSVYRNPKSN